MIEGVTLEVPFVDWLNDLNRHLRQRKFVALLCLCEPKELLNRLFLPPMFEVYPFVSRDGLDGQHRLRSRGVDAPSCYQGTAFPLRRRGGDLLIKEWLMVKPQSRPVNPNPDEIEENIDEEAVAAAILAEETRVRTGNRPPG